jgi:hypothetical protein
VSTRGGGRWPSQLEPPNGPHVLFSRPSVSPPLRSPCQPSAAARSRPLRAGYSPKTTPSQGRAGGGGEHGGACTLVLALTAWYTCIPARRGRSLRRPASLTTLQASAYRMFFVWKSQFKVKENLKLSRMSSVVRPAVRAGFSPNACPGWCSPMDA